MNFVRSRLSIGNLLGSVTVTQQKTALLIAIAMGQRISQTWSHRGMCIKPQEVKGQTPSGGPANAKQAGFKVPGYRPSEMDKRMLLWSGRFKSADQIPEFVSFEMIDAARNRMRVKACYVMIIATIGACVVMIIQGKQAAHRHESLSVQNMEKKAKWRAEVEKERESQAALAQKPQ